ncbi:Macrolide export protein MacA [Candidatus Magnetaquicoccaceae bacterium FCR-1]|uniref:Macrolide export protein MacA n=1 Tax=Candidatus Magnetaquiglobus chichijimensis TaxID=3141448 RepID=A0ABQ0CBJ4_9PROT
MSGIRKLVIFALLVVLGTGGWYAWSKRDGADKGLQTTAKVIRGDIEETTTALGTLQPLNYVDVGTQVSGQLMKIHVALGDTVKSGDLLAEIDPTLFITKVESDRAQLQVFEAQLAERKAHHALAKAQYDRQKGMLAANATSQDAHQSAEATLKGSTAQIAQITAQIRQTEFSLKANETNLAFTRILAPMTGTVVTLPARQGQTLIAAQQAPILLRIADLSTMTVWTQVSEADITRLKLGMEAWFTTLGQPDKRHYGKLRQILPSPDVVNSVVLYNALFDVENPNLELGIQMSAQVSFVHAMAKDALLLPITALAIKGKPGEATARLLQDGTPITRKVTLGVKNRLQAQILSGLEEGNEVLIGGAEKKPTSGGSIFGMSHPGGGKPR